MNIKISGLLRLFNRDISADVSDINFARKNGRPIYEIKSHNQTVEFSPRFKYIAKFVKLLCDERGGVHKAHCIQVYRIQNARKFEINKAHMLRMAGA